MASILKYNKAQHTNGTDAMTISSAGIITPSKPVIATMNMSTATHDHTEQSWHLNSWDNSDIDTYGSVANLQNNRFDIPVAGYYEVYYQACLGVTGEGGSMRDSGIIISQTPSGGSETVVSSTHHRHYDGAGQDTSDLMEITHCIIQCAAADQIKFRHYVNTDTGTAYDVYAKVAEDENTHMYYASTANAKATHCWLRRVA